VLAGVAGLLGAGSGEAGRGRLRALGRRPPGQPGRGLSRTSNRAGHIDRLGSSRAVARVAAGLVAVLVLTGRTGVAVPVAVAGVALLGPARRRAAVAARRQARIARDLPRAADLMATCLQAGLAPAEAVALVSEVVGGPLRDLLLPVAAAIRLGVDPAHAWAELADADQRPSRTSASGEAPRRLARAFARAAATGAPLADTLTTVADDERERLRWAAEAAARRAGVRAVGPLAVCFLPAFLLLGVVPVVVGVARDVLGQLG
jgi:pilus assembly protein TadC